MAVSGTTAKKLGTLNYKPILISQRNAPPAELVSHESGTSKLVVLRLPIRKKATANAPAVNVSICILSQVTEVK